MARDPERDDGAGPSGGPRWQEAAKYFIQALGAPIDAWNFGVDDYARDINARPFYVNWMDATALISVHNNGGGQRPAVIVEIAYMDTPTPDNDALHDDAFKRIVAEAIADAVREWASAAGDDRR
jgi:hypothetical protein